jgi:hypothetical protein
VVADIKALSLQIVCDSAVSAGEIVLVKMVTSSVDGGQVPVEILHLSKFAPSPRPVTVVPGDAELANVPEPFTTLHVPDPNWGALPASVVDCAHTVWSAPAFAIDNEPDCMTVTLDDDGAQGAFEMVQIKTFVPVLSPETVVDGEPGALMLAEPAPIDQLPLPYNGAVAASVAFVAHTACVLPAKAGETVTDLIITSS